MLSYRVVVLDGRFSQVFGGSRTVQRGRVSSRRVAEIPNQLSNSKRVCIRIVAARGARALRRLTPSQEKQEGAGKARCALHPRSRAQNANSKTHTSIQVQRKHSGLPCAMVLRLTPRSPR